jgi:hypothetical protein
MTTVWFLLALLAFPGEPVIQYKGFYAYHTLEECEMQKMSLETFIVKNEMMKGLKTAIYVETYCLEMQAFLDQLKKYKENKQKGISLGAKEVEV